jgi:hypothetical protein
MMAVSAGAVWCLRQWGAGRRVTGDVAKGVGSCSE